jgi:hypothetical protein
MQKKTEPTADPVNLSDNFKDKSFEADIDRTQAVLP